jgi:hypothetical protein
MSKKPASFPAYLSTLRHVLLAGGFALCTQVDAASLKLSDSFNRTAAAGSWGTANTGGSWAVSGVPVDFSVNSTNGGQITLSSGSTSSRLAILGTNTYENVEGTVTIAWSAVPTSNSVFAGSVLRVNSSNNTFYLVRAHLSTSGDVVLGFQTVVSNTSTSIGTAQTVVTGYTAGTKLKMRFAAAGKSPTYLKAKVWKASDEEPMLWQVETTDSTAGLQVAGKCGLRAGHFSNFTNWGLALRFDDAAFHDVAFVSNIKTAITAAVAGDIIYFTGVHTSRPVTAVHGTATAPIIVRGINATIDGGAYNAGYGLDIKHNYYWFDDFTVRKVQKAFVASAASFGRATNIDALDIGEEAFKFRRNSQHWDVVKCSVDQTGMLEQPAANPPTASVPLHDYGEAYYVGQASENWVTVNNILTPDTTSYITFDQCTATRLCNDAFDIKEGSHHVKIKNCVIDFVNGGPINGHPRGDSGMYLRGDDIQIINTTIKDHPRTSPDMNIAPAACFRIWSRAVNSVNYGKNVKLKNVTGLRIDGNFANIVSGFPGVIVYDDCVYTTTGGISGPYTTAAASAFVEENW